MRFTVRGPELFTQSGQTGTKDDEIIALNTMTIDLY
jgi:hypothetical protein